MKLPSNIVVAGSYNLVMSESAGMSAYAAAMKSPSVLPPQPFVVVSVTYGPGFSGLTGGGQNPASPPIVSAVASLGGTVASEVDEVTVGDEQPISKQSNSARTR